MAKPIYGSWVGKEKLGNNFQKKHPKDSSGIYHVIPETNEHMLWWNSKC